MLTILQMYIYLGPTPVVFNYLTTPIFLPFGEDAKLGTDFSECRWSTAAKEVSFRSDIQPSRSFELYLRIWSAVRKD